jgi:hypothetical protein
MNTVHSPRLQAASKAGATGRTNVLGNGLEGSGPMGVPPLGVRHPGRQPGLEPLLGPHDLHLVVDSHGRVGARLFGAVAGGRTTPKVQAEMLADLVDQVEGGGR